MRYFVYILVGSILLAAIVIYKLADGHKTKKESYILTAYWLYMLSLAISWLYLLGYYYFIKKNIFVCFGFILSIIPFYYYGKNLKKSLNSKNVKNQERSYENFMDIIIHYLRIWLEIIALILLLFIISSSQKTAELSLKQEINNALNLVYIYILGMPFCLIPAVLHWLIVKLQQKYQQRQAE